MREHDVTVLTTAELEAARRELAASLALARPGALDIQILYRPGQDQATIWAILTDTTPPLSAPCSATPA
jgi:hypothetical protein